MHEAAAPDPFGGILPGDPRGLIPVAGPEHDVLADLRGLTVSREALGLEPSAAYLLGEHMRRVHDALNDQENRLLERAFLPPGLRRPESGADCG